MINDFKINDLPFPQVQELEDIIPFLCKSVGLSKDIELKTLTILFTESKYGKGVTPDEIAAQIDVKAKDVHAILERLMTIGIARKSRDRYVLRETSMSMTLDAILDDIFLISRNLKRACVIVDRKATKNAVTKLLQDWKNVS